MAHTRFHEQLRQGSAVAEHIRLPQRHRLLAELLAEEALAVEDLPDQRLAAGDVDVGFDPHRPLHLPAPFGDTVLDPFVERGVVLLDPCILLRLAGAENVVGIALQHRQRGREGAAAFADRLADRPKPGEIHMRVPDRPDRQRRGFVAAGEFRAQNGARRNRFLFGEISQQVSGFFQRTPQLHRTAAVVGQLLQQRVQDLEIVVQRVQLGVADRNCRFLQDAVVAPDAEEIVGAGLNPEIDRLSAVRRGAERHDALSRLAKLAREAGTDAGQPEQRPALRIDDAALAAQIDQQHDLLAGSGRRHRAGEVKPGAVERRLAPALSRAQRELAALPALGERHRLGRHPGGGAQLSDGRVDGRLDRLLDVAERAGCRDRRVGHSTLFPGAAPIAQPRCNGSRHKVNEIESGRGYSYGRYSGVRRLAKSVSATGARAKALPGHWPSERSSPRQCRLSTCCSTLPRRRPSSALRRPPALARPVSRSAPAGAPPARCRRRLSPRRSAV